METSHDRTEKAILTVLVLVGFVISGLSVAADWLGFDTQPGFGLTQTIMLVSGISLSAISGWFLVSASIDARWIWRVALASLLLVGIAIRFVEFTYDRFDYDEYDLMKDVNRSFSEYVRLSGADSIQFTTHYWLSNRLLGNSLTTYRVMSLIAGVALLLLTPVWLMRFWPTQKTVALVVLLILMLNGDALYLSRYALFPYGNTYLLSAGLFFLLMRLAEGPLENRQWLWISAISVPAAFFSNIFLIVPLATGALSVIAFRWWRSVSSRNLASLWRWAWESKSLLIFPLVYAFKQFLFPVISSWGPYHRPDHMHLFFPTSGYSATFLGMARFVSARTYSLLVEILAPAGVHHVGARTTILVLWGVLAAIAFVQVARDRADQRAKFTVLFLLTTLTSIVIAGLLGLYPYGWKRYIPYLTMPCAVLAGIGGSWVYHWVFQRPRLYRLWSVLLMYLAVLVLIGGSYLIVARRSQIANTEASDEQALSWLRSEQPDIVLADNYIAAVLCARAPEVYERSHRMGWGAWLGKGDMVPPELADIITGAGQSQPVDTILVVLFPHEFSRVDPHAGFAQRYPDWNGLLRANFDLETSAEGSNIWMGLYRRK